MKFFRRLLSARPAIYLAMAGAVLVSMLCAMAMAVSPEHHEHVHHDADEEEHECLVTHLMAGNLGDGAAPSAVELHPLPCDPEAERLFLEEQAVAPLHLTDGVLEHAPPAIG
jgi:hypothetical protein